MDPACGEFLARTALTDQQNWAVDLGNAHIEFAGGGPGRRIRGVLFGDVNAVFVAILRYDDLRYYPAAGFDVPSRPGDNFPGLDGDFGDW